MPGTLLEDHGFAIDCKLDTQTRMVVFLVF